MSDCGYCKRKDVIVKESKHEILYTNGKVEEVFNRRCGWCGNLLYGYSKRKSKED